MLNSGCCNDCVAVAVPVPGPPGPPGENGDGTDYYHTQVAPSSSWTVPHNLGRQIVGALVYSADLSIQYGNVFVEQVSPNLARLWMSPPLPGIARIY